MQSPTDPDAAARLLPQDAAPCIWMDAGLVAYRLCDRDFDCDGCPFDAAMRGDSGLTPVDESSREETAAWGFPRDRRYHPRHGWIAPSGDLVRWGLDVFAAGLLGGALNIVLPVDGSPLRRGRRACWVGEEGGMVPLRSPISGTVTRVNVELQQRPSLLVADPYGDGWLVEARCDAALEQQPGLVDARSQASRRAADLAKLLRHAGAPVVGPTAADGGERILDLHRTLGVERYQRLVRLFLD